MQKAALSFFQQNILAPLLLCVLENLMNTCYTNDALNNLGAQIFLISRQNIFKTTPYPLRSIPMKSLMLSSRGLILSERSIRNTILAGWEHSTEKILQRY